MHVYHDESIGFAADLHVMQEQGTLTIATQRFAASPEYYPATYATFRIINDTIANIETIEGKPKCWYAPFRNSPLE
ncbi:hypothetical protein, partial [Nocardia sp. NPDC058497]|uniref:hypothetical protein n=1 Tax=Nocardia sp. NPDC058497 TaxID=3346529 RepID=UPI00365017C5